MTEEAETPAARAIRERLEALGMTEPDLIRAAPVDADTLRTIRRGVRTPNGRTRAKLEAALDWPEGTLFSLLKGDLEPEEVATIRRDVTLGQTTDSTGDHVTLELDIPLAVWKGMTELERQEVIHTATAVVLRRVNEIREGREP